MKKCFFIILLLSGLFVSGLKAQDDVENYVGIKGGISIPNLTAGGSENNPINTGYSSSIGPNFAAFYEKVISDKLSLVTQLEYAAEGGKKNGFQAFTLPAQYASMFPPGQAPLYLYADFNSEVKINYLMLSELAKLDFKLGANSPFSIYIDAGPFGALLISAHQVVSGSSMIYADEGMQMPLTTEPQSFDSTQSIKDQLHTGNFGIEGDIGFAFSLNNHKIFIEGGGNYGFMNIQKGTENGKNNIGAATVRVGYAYGF
jgi:hypothetical protein